MIQYKYFLIDIRLTKKVRNFLLKLYKYRPLKATTLISDDFWISALKTLLLFQNAAKEQFIKIGLFFDGSYDQNEQFLANMMGTIAYHISMVLSRVRILKGLEHNIVMQCDF